MKFFKIAFLSIFATTKGVLGSEANGLEANGSEANGWLRRKTQSCVNDPFYVIAHMTNLPSTAEWGLQQGANALEMDLNFETWKFHHGAPCDCWCRFGTEGICGLHDPVCTGGTDVDTMFNELVKSKYRDLAMVYIDSKIGSIKGSKAAAGERVADKIMSILFTKGYKGIVIVAVPDLSGVEYLQAVADTIKRTGWEGRVFYNIDMERNVVHVLEALIKISPYRAFSTGISACVHGNYHDEIRLASLNYAAGVISLPPGIWTLDKTSSMEEYIDFGARSIMTNKPAKAVSVSGSNGYDLAAPSFRPGKATSDVIVRSKSRCDCDFHTGGCSISTPAPNGQSCRCEYEGAWTCTGSVMPCACESSYRCKWPDYSVQSCVQGGGDCDGYSGDSSCDCDYHSGGCSISKAAPKYSACKCKYKGWWTCGGDVVRCSNDASPLCANPDKSKEACGLGSGDCDGY